MKTTMYIEIAKIQQMQYNRELTPGKRVLTELILTEHFKFSLDGF